MFQFIYDVLVWLSTNYSQMPDDFRERFPEKFFVRLRLDIGSFIANLQNWYDYD